MKHTTRKFRIISLIIAMAFLCQAALADELRPSLGYNYEYRGSLGMATGDKLRPLAAGENGSRQLHIVSGGRRSYPALERCEADLQYLRKSLAGSLAGAEKLKKFDEVIAPFRDSGVLLEDPQEAEEQLRLNGIGIRWDPELSNIFRLERNALALRKVRDEKYNSDGFIRTLAIPEPGGRGYIVDTVGFPGKWNIGILTGDTAAVERGGILRLAKSLNYVRRYIDESAGSGRQVADTGVLGRADFTFEDIFIVDSKEDIDRFVGPDTRLRETSEGLYLQINAVDGKVTVFATLTCLETGRARQRRSLRQFFAKPADCKSIVMAGNAAASLTRKETLESAIAPAPPSAAKGPCFKTCVLLTGGHMGSMYAYNMGGNNYGFSSHFVSDEAAQKPDGDIMEWLFLSNRLADYEQNPNFEIWVERKYMPIAVKAISVISKTLNNPHVHLRIIDGDAGDIGFPSSVKVDANCKADFEELMGSLKGPGGGRNRDPLYRIPGDFSYTADPEDVRVVFTKAHSNATRMEVGSVLGVHLLMDAVERRGYQANMVKGGHVDAHINYSSRNIYCISANTFDLKENARLISEIRAKDPEAFIIMGGPAASLPEQVLANTPEVDILIRGEAETVLSDVIDIIAKAGGRSQLTAGQLEQLSGIKGVYVQSGRRILISDLDANNYEQEIAMPVLGTTNMIAFARGCPFNCNFCSKVSGRKYRAASFGTMTEFLTGKLAIASDLPNNIAQGIMSALGLGGVFSGSTLHELRKSNYVLRRPFEKWECSPAEVLGLLAVFEQPVNDRHFTDWRFSFDAETVRGVSHILGLGDMTNLTDLRRELGTTQNRITKKMLQDIVFLFRMQWARALIEENNKSGGELLVPGDTSEYLRGKILLSEEGDEMLGARNVLMPLAGWIANNHFERFFRFRTGQSSIASIYDFGKNRPDVEYMLGMVEAGFASPGFGIDGMTNAALRQHNKPRYTIGQALECYVAAERVGLVVSDNNFLTFNPLTTEEDVAEVVVLSHILPIARGQKISAGTVRYMAGSSFGNEGVIVDPAEFVKRAPWSIASRFPEYSVFEEMGIAPLAPMEGSIEVPSVQQVQDNPQYYPYFQMGHAYFEYDRNHCDEMLKRWHQDADPEMQALADLFELLRSRPENSSKTNWEIIEMIKKKAEEADFWDITEDYGYFRYLLKLEQGINPSLGDQFKRFNEERKSCSDVWVIMLRWRQEQDPEIKAFAELYSLYSNRYRDVNITPAQMLEIMRRRVEGIVISRSVRGGYLSYLLEQERRQESPAASAQLPNLAETAVLSDVLRPRPYVDRGGGQALAAGENGNLASAKLASDENKRLLIDVLRVLNRHLLLRQGVIPDLPGLLAKESWDDKRHFNFLPDRDGELVYVNETYILGLDDPNFSQVATGVMNIIYGRTIEGVLVGLSRSDEKVLAEWEIFIRRSGIKIPGTKLAGHGVRNRPVLKKGFAEAASGMSDTLFAAFIDQLQMDIIDAIYDVATKESFGGSEPPLVSAVKKRLACRAFVKGKLTLARPDNTGALCIRYPYSKPLGKSEGTAQEHPKTEEEKSPVFGILTTEFIDILQNSGLLEEYHDIYCDTPIKIQASGQNSYLLVQHLVKGEPITEKNFSTPERYNQFIDIVIRYKLRTGELNFDLLDNADQKIDLIRIVQRRLNGAFGLEEGRNLIPLDCLMLFGKLQANIHLEYGGDKIQGVTEYIDPLSHTLNALRMLRTDRLPGARCALRTAMLLHDIGKKYSTRGHDARSEEMVESGLVDMGASDFTPDGHVLTKVLVGTHATSGSVYVDGRRRQPTSQEIAEKLKVPSALADRISVQTFYLLHKRIYEADTSSIADICWLCLPPHIKERPQMATQAEKTLATQEWHTHCRQVFEASIIYYYGELYAKNEHFRGILNSMGVDERIIGVFFERLFTSPEFPRFFIHSNAEDFDMEPAFRVVSRTLTGIVPAAANFEGPLKACIENYFVINDLGVPPPAGIAAATIYVPAEPNRTGSTEASILRPLVAREKGDTAQSLVKGGIPEGAVSQEEKRLINEGWAVAWDLKTVDRILQILEKETAPTGGECNYLLCLLFPKKRVLGFLSKSPIPEGDREALRNNLGQNTRRKDLAAAIRKQRKTLEDVNHNPSTYRNYFKENHRVRARRSIIGDKESSTPALTERVFITCFSAKGNFAEAQVLGHGSSQNNTIAMHINGINGLGTEGLGLVMLHEHMDAIRGRHEEDISDDIFNTSIRYPWQDLLVSRRVGETDAARLIKERRQQAVTEVIEVIRRRITPLNIRATKTIENYMTIAHGDPASFEFSEEVWKEYIDIFNEVCGVLGKYGIREGMELKAELSKAESDLVNISNIMANIFLESGKVFVFVHSSRQLGNFTIRKIPKIVIYDIGKHGPQRDINIRGTDVSLYVAYSRGYILPPLIKEDEVFMNAYLGVQIQGLQLVVVNENRYIQEVQDYYEIRKSIYLYNRLPDKMITPDEDYNNAYKELVKRQWLDDEFKKYVDMDIQDTKNGIAGKTDFFNKHYKPYVDDSLKHEACHEAVRSITVYGGSECLTNLHDLGESDYRWIRMLLLARDVIFMPTPEYRAMHEFLMSYTLPLAAKEARLGTGPGMTRKELLRVMARLPKDILTRRCRTDFDELRRMFAQGARISDIQRKAISAVEASI